MQVILREDIKSLGKAGEVVKVKDGYARNFLLPQGKALQADPKNLKELEHHQKAVAARQSKLRKQAEELAQKLSQVSLTLRRQAGGNAAASAGEAEKIFGSVTTKDISDALRRENLPVDKKLIVLSAPIKQLGVFEASVKLHPEVTATLKIWVVKE